MRQSVGVVNSNQVIQEKISSYKCDVIYATNNELGFDYLRDNMAHRVEDNGCRCSLDFAIVDEVDSKLIDNKLFKTFNVSVASGIKFRLV